MESKSDGSAPKQGSFFPNASYQQAVIDSSPKTSRLIVLHILFFFAYVNVNVLYCPNPERRVPEINPIQRLATLLPYTCTIRSWTLWTHTRRAIRFTERLSNM